MSVVCCVVLCVNDSISMFITKSVMGQLAFFYWLVSSLSNANL